MHGRGGGERDLGREEAEEDGLGLVPDVVGGLRGLHRPQHLPLPEPRQHRLRLLRERCETLLDALDVVVRPPRRLPPLQQPLLQLLLRALEVEAEGHGRAVPDLPFPALAVVEGAGEAVDEEAAGGGGLHGLEEQTDGDLHRHDLALLDVILDQRRVRRLRRLLLTQQVSRRQVHPPELLHDVGALRALPGPRPPQHKHHLGLLEQLLHIRPHLLHRPR
mmetsp:Transcript_14790/g.29674  ORF Transcript_14790/g.29674 Transcript_14790/m.29674 type:complete len:219 (+) Transcript_14790:231-887(+)